MPAPVKVGDILAGKYRVEHVLGTGGMGVVVAARHLQLGERVAIKYLQPQALSNADLVQRFLREGRASVRIRSEHVARIYDVGTLEDGTPYLVMEYLDGRDLGAILLKNGPFEIAVAVDYVLQACEALAEVHSLGIVHRDLKPGNLFLTKRTDGSPAVKVIDFGVSKVVATGDLMVESYVTKTAVMMGSPIYMAPEQMASARDADSRADIWSLGVILHHLIAGAPPFEGQTVMQLYDQMLRGAPKLRSVRPEAPAGLEEAILRCVRRERDERWPDVAALAAALAPFGSTEAIGSAVRAARILKASREDLAGRPSQRRPAMSHDALTVPIDALLNTERPPPPSSARPRAAPPAIVSAREPRDEEGLPLALQSGPSSRPRGGPTSTPIAGPASTPRAGPTATPIAGPVSTKAGPASTPIAGPVSTPKPGPASRPIAGPASTPIAGPASLKTGPASGPDRPRISDQSDVSPDLLRALGEAAPSTRRPRPRDVDPSVREPDAATPEPPSSAARRAEPPRPLPPPAIAEEPPSRTGRWIALLVAAILVATGVLYYRSRTPGSASGASAGESDPARRARLAAACDGMRERIGRGASFGPGEREGWVVELWLARRGEPTVRKSPALERFVDGGKLTQLADVTLAGVADGAAEITEGPRDAAGWQATTISLREGYARAFLDNDARPRFVALADRIAGASGAELGALYARCAHLTAHDMGAWFRGNDAAGAAAAMLHAMGLAADPAVVSRAALGGQGDIEGLRAAAERLGPAMIEVVVKAEGGSFTKEAGVTVTFPLSAPTRATSASRAAAKKMGVGG